MKGFQVTILVTLMLFRFTICQPGHSGASKGSQHHSSSLGSGGGFGHSEQNTPVHHFSGINLIQNGNFTVPFYQDTHWHPLKNRMALPWIINPQGWSVNARYQNPDFKVDRAFLFGSPGLGQLGSSLRQTVTLGAAGMYTFAFSYGLIGPETPEKGDLTAQIDGLVVADIPFINLSPKKAYFFKANIECKHGQIQVLFRAYRQRAAIQRIMISNIWLIKDDGSLQQQMEVHSVKVGDEADGNQVKRLELAVGASGDDEDINSHQNINYFRNKNKLRNGDFEFPPLGLQKQKKFRIIPKWKTQQNSWLVDCRRLCPWLSQGQAYMFTHIRQVKTATLSQSFNVWKPGQCLIRFDYGTPLQSSKQGTIQFEVNGLNLITIKRRVLKENKKYTFLAYFPCKKGINSVIFIASDFTKLSSQIFVTGVFVMKIQILNKLLKKL